MSAKYCKRIRCSQAREGNPCKMADACAFFDWDIDRENGDKPTTGNPLESKEQEEFAAWCDKKGLLWAHIPNERKATVRVLAELERQGLKKGFPDNFIAEPNGKYSGLFIELKRAKKCLSRVSKEQKEWIKALNAKGYAACVCYGAENAKKAVIKYLQEEQSTVDTLNRVIDFIVKESSEDCCLLCAYLADFPPTPDDVEPCPYKRANGYTACRNGMIEHFSKAGKK